MNIVWIPNFNNYIKWEGTIESWKTFCEKNDAHLLIGESVDHTPPVWNKWLCLDFISTQNISNINNILMVDGDTVVNNNVCPAFLRDLDTTDNNIYVTKDQGPLEAIQSAVNQANPHYENKLTVENYFNAGMLVLSLDSLKKITHYIWKIYDIRKRQNFYSFDVFEQTPINYICNKILKINYIDSSYNRMFYNKSITFLLNNFVNHFTSINLTYEEKIKTINGYWGIYKKRNNI